MFNSNTHHAAQNAVQCLFSRGENKNTAGPLCLFIARGMFGTCDIMKLQSTAECLSQQQTQGQSRVAAACQQHPLPSRCPSTSAAPTTWREPPPAAACAQLPSSHPQPKNGFVWGRSGTASCHLCHAHNTHLAHSPGTASVAVVTSTHLLHRQTDTSIRPAQPARMRWELWFLPAQRDLSKTAASPRGTRTAGVARAAGIPSPAAGPLPAAREARLIHPVLLFVFFFLKLAGIYLFPQSLPTHKPNLGSKPKCLNRRSETKQKASGRPAPAALTSPLGGYI